MSVVEEKDTCASGQPAGILPFDKALTQHGLALTREITSTLQVNLGFVCNLECRHCHVDAGPDRKETMDEVTVKEVISYAARSKFSVIDITGGSPEMNKNLVRLIEGVRPFTQKIMIRSNLTTLADDARDNLIETFVKNRVAIVASLPSLNKKQTETQRGDGVFGRSIAAMRKLNEKGYGEKGSGLILDLVSNPVGAFFSPSQVEVEVRFKKEMARKWDVTFNNLFAFANVPLGRFEKWLETSGNLTGYYQKLAESFNPGAVAGVMCKRQVSVSWDGMMHDCDFHLAEGVPLGGVDTHVSSMTGPPEEGSAIALCDYCYTCVAGAGFTCGGAIE